MKTRKWSFIAILMCVSLLFPQITALADGIDEFSDVEAENTEENTEEAEESDGSESSDETTEVEQSEEVKVEDSDETEDIVESEEVEDSDGDFEALDEEELEYFLELEDMGMMPMLFAMPLGLDPDLGLQPTSGAHGSGSYQLNKIASDYRFYTEYFVSAEQGKSTTSAGVERRTYINVYAKEGEILLFGSSVTNSQIDENNNSTGSVTGKDIVITTPSGQKICKNVLAPEETDSDGNVRPNGLGFIKNPTHEMNGPMVNTADESYPETYYVPLQYEVTESGVYKFEFHSVTGVNPKSAPSGYHPSPKLASESWSQGNTSVAAWDITVLGKNDSDVWEVKSGRAWADYLALTTGGGEGKTSDLNVHVLTHDGYLYQVDFTRAVPYGFIFFANNTGFMTAVTDEKNNTTYRPIYHSFYDSTNDLDYMKDENIYLHKPNESDTETQETYKIFFNEPNDDLDGVEYVAKNGNGLDKIRTKPDELVKVEELKFNGDSHQNIARTGHGGYFTFKSSGEAMVTIRMDLRRAIFESGSFIENSYNGSGIVEITVPAVKGSNRVYWDGKDTDGIVLPAGIYGNSNVVIATEIKRGELHFPVIDMEGLYGGLTVKRLNGANRGSDADYNLYYNNNPLVYGTIEGSEHSKKVEGVRYVMSDGTKSFKAYTDRSDNLSKYFVYGSDAISTLKKDDQNYLANILFNKSYAELNEAEKEIIDAEYGKEVDTFHYEPINSKNISMKFNCSGFEGGGDRAGIDAWTYYTQGIDSQLISFAIMDTDSRGIVKGQIFYDKNISSNYDTGDEYLSGVKVRLIDSHGEPLVHTESLPCFDDKGNFVYDENGKIKHEEKDVIFEAETDSTGTYRFTGVPYSPDSDTTYYVQVQLNDVQSEVLRYTCTTSNKIQSELITIDGNHFHNNIIDEYEYGPDGNAITTADFNEKIYGHKYDRDDNYDIKVDLANAQSVTFTSADSSDSSLVVTKEFKKIGYSSALPDSNRKNYTVKKSWGKNSQGYDTHEISDGIIVELWVWNDSAVKEEHKDEITRRTGALMDTQVLNTDNSWSYTWENLDDRLQYYVLEYYTKKKSNGEIIYNDKGEPRKVLIGGTMPIFSYVPDGHSGKYGFTSNLGEYPETKEDASGKYIPIQKFSDPAPNEHANSITKQEKLEAIDNNARQYNVTYKLSVTADEKTNVIVLNNSQVYDDRAYYVWLDHETELPDFISQSFVVAGIKDSHAVELQKDKLISDGEYTIKGLSITSVDAAQTENTESNATSAFRIKEHDASSSLKEKCSALFTPNRNIYKTGTGTRTYHLKYVVDATSKSPVSVTTNNSGELVLTDNPSVKVESDSNYIVYSWFMTIHVYDVQSDGIIEYDPNNGPVILQESLPSGVEHELKWTLTHDGTNFNSISYKSNDKRTSGILQNDTFRVPLYKAAEIPDMGSCADIVGIAYAGNTTVSDISGLIFEDTFDSIYGNHDSDTPKEDGIAIAQGSGGYVTVNLNTKRNTRINRVQDHANYADVTFTPGGMTKSALGEDVFYYKIVVFAEDNTYQNASYDDIDASDGVVMYAYFIMKPKQEAPSGAPSGSPSGNPGNNSSVAPSEGLEVKSSIDPSKPPKIILKETPVNPDDLSAMTDVISPKTGDNNNILTWILLACVGGILIIFNLRQLIIYKKHR